MNNTEEKKRSKRYGVPNKIDEGSYTSKLKWVRQMKGYSQQSLADASGVGVRAIRSFECKERDINQASVLTVYKLATVLGVSIEQLIDP